MNKIVLYILKEIVEERLSITVAHAEELSKKFLALGFCPNDKLQMILRKKDLKGGFAYHDPWIEGKDVCQFQILIKFIQKTQYIKTTEHKVLFKSLLLIPD